MGSSVTTISVEAAAVATPPPPLSSAWNITTVSVRHEPLQTFGRILVPLMLGGILSGRG